MEDFDPNSDSQGMKLSKWKQVGLPISKDIVNHLRKTLNFNKITKVQREVVPLFVSNKDLCVKACTGSGKTLAYLVSILQILLNNQEDADSHPKKHDIQALILVPARELAIQVNNVLSSFLQIFPYLKVYWCIGGKKISEDIDQYKEQGANIIIGTVGRIWDFMERGILNFKPLQVLVIDEADLLISQGSQIKLNQIMDKIPKQRRTGLFSATMTSGVKDLVRAGLRNPYYVEIFSYKNEELRKNYEPFAIEDLREEYAKIDDFEVVLKDEENGELYTEVKLRDVNVGGNVINEIPSTLTNYYILVETQKDKLSFLLEFIKKNGTNQKYMIFFGTCASVEYYAYILYHLFQKFKIPNRKVVKLHRKVRQEQRAKVYEKFVKLSSGILLTTDVSARGLDIPDIDWIVQFDPPQHSDQFIHRIGRTARAGKEGESIILLQNNEFPYVEFLKSRKVHILEMKQEPSISEKEIREHIQSLMRKDKDIIEKSINAFVAFIRYYKEHELKYIFSFIHLCIGSVANSFALFTLPRIKEILGKKIENFESKEIDKDSIQYLDPNKKKQKEEGKEKADEIKLKKREEKERRKELSAKQREEKNKITRTQKNRRKKEAQEEDWEDIAKEQRLLKKLRKGKITKAMFDELVYGDL